MVHITGVEGSVISETQIVLGIDNWAADMEVDPIETTDYDSDGYKDHIAGNKGITGTFEGNWDTSSNISADPPNLNEGEIVALELFLQDSTVPIQKILCDALITGVNITVPQPDKIRFTVSFVSTGSYSKEFSPI